VEWVEIDARDKELIQAAIDVIRKNFQDGRHTVGAAVLCTSGKIFVGVNIDTVGYGPCAEPIALGAAISSGEREFSALVAVSGWNPSYPVISPCGNCRQLLMEYAPEAYVILRHNDKLLKTKARNLLPNAFRSFGDDEKLDDRIIG
jgi:cytidine deaminase